jgi:iron-sulfur cluster assembly accessory protein
MIHLSQAAANEVRRMQASQGRLSTRLRVRVQKGGCSGLYYTLALETPSLTDAHHPLPEGSLEITHSQDIAIAIDANSISLLTGLTIDFSEDLMGGAFRFHNPNATTTCGCGLSFTT